LDSNPHAQAAKPIAGTLSIYQFVRTNNSKWHNIVFPQIDLISRIEPDFKDRYR
jgi:hypothetical protein